MHSGPLIISLIVSGMAGTENEREQYGQCCGESKFLYNVEMSIDANIIEDTMEDHQKPEAELRTSNVTS